jgi:hypothetical protein
VEGYLYSSHQFTEGLREWALKVDTGNFPFTVNLVREVRSCWRTPTSSPKRTCSCTREVGMTRTTWSLRVISQENSFFWSSLTDYSIYNYDILKDTERKELTTFKGTDILQQYMRLHPTLYSHLYAFFTLKQQSSWVPQGVPQLPSTQPDTMTSLPPQANHLPQQPHSSHPFYGHPHSFMPLHGHSHTGHGNPFGAMPQAAAMGMGGMNMGGGMGMGQDPYMRPHQPDVLTKILQPLPVMFSTNMPTIDQVLEDQKFTLMLVYKYYLKLADTENPIDAIEGLLEKMSYPAFVKCHVDTVIGGRRATPVESKIDNFCWVAANEQFVNFVSGLAKKPVPRSSVLGKRAHSVELGLEKKSADQYAQTDIDCSKGPGYIHTTPLKEGVLLHKIATPDKRLIFGILAPNPQNTQTSMSIYPVHSPSPSPMAGSPASTASTITVNEEEDLTFGTHIGAEEFNLLLDTMIGQQ